MQRTDWAEEFLDKCLAIPLTHECVYLRPHYLPANKELCDLILRLRDRGIMISLKCQENPTQKTGAKLKSWGTKTANKAIGQIKGAARAVKERHFYCNHARMGRVDFQANAIKLKHLLVLVETFEPVNLDKDLPLSHSGIPVSYLSTNDFLNLVKELRAFPEIERYLNARRALPDETRKMLGVEQTLYDYFILLESFDGCNGLQHAREYANGRARELHDARRRKAQMDSFAFWIEDVADQLAIRHPEYKEGLSEEMQAGFDDPDNRKNYLLMQNELCDLQLSDRRLLGGRFKEIIERTRKTDQIECMAYQTSWIDTKPDFVYVLVSSKGVVRQELLKRCSDLLLGALSFYLKNRGMVIADRDGESYEVQIMTKFQRSPEADELGKQFFTGLRMYNYPSTFVPEVSEGLR